MEKIISKEELSEFEKIEGELRGVVLATYGKFILKEEGDNGLDKLEKKMEKIGYPIKLKEIKVTDFYPLRLQAIILTLIKNLFNYNKDNFVEMGRFESKADTVVIRFFMKYFVSLEMVIKVVQRMWKTYFTVGDIKAVDYDKRKNQLILRLERFPPIPILCNNLRGYFEGITEIIVKTKVVCEETKCPFKGDEYHEFLIKW